MESGIEGKFNELEALIEQRVKGERLVFTTSYFAFMDGVIQCGQQAILYNHINLASAYAIIARALVDGAKPGDVVFDLVMHIRDARGIPFGADESDLQLAANWQKLLDSVTP